jgi:xylulokinase
MYLMAVDLGSTSIKAVIFDYSGNMISAGRRRTKVTYRKEGGKTHAFWMPDDLWERVSGSIRDALSYIDDPCSIKAVSVTGFACDGVPIDGKGDWIYPFISWHDSCTIEQFEWLSHYHSFEEIYLINGQRPWNLNTIFRNLWVKQNLPEIYKKIYKWLLIEDYINFKLCGKIATDYSLASTTLVFDQKKLDWSEKLFNIFGINMNIYPDAYPSSTYLGGVSREASKKTGLKEGMPVILGGLDGLCGVYAAAGDQHRDLVGVVGTYEHYHKCLDRPILKKEGLRSTIICQAHVIKGKYDIYGVSVSSGILEWFRENFAGMEEQEAEKMGSNIWDILMQDAERSEQGANGVFMLTDIFGSTCPVQDNYSRGAFIGISSTSKKSDFIRAALEGINYKGFELYETISKYTETSGEKIIVTGGAVRNELWMQMKADMCGKIVEVPEIEESTPLGAAMCAGIGVGVYKDFSHAYKSIKKPSKFYYPDSKRHKKYMEYYKKVYSRIYKVLKSINHYISTSIP